MRVRFLTAFLVALLFAGPAVAAPPPEEGVAPLTSQAVLDVAGAVVRSLRERNRAAFLEQWSLQGFANKVFEGNRLPLARRERQASKALAKYFDVIVAEIKSGVGEVAIEVRRLLAPDRVLVRFVVDGGGIGYWELEVASMKGAVRVMDLLDYQLGVELSKPTRWGHQLTEAANSKNVTSQSLAGLFRRHHKAINRMNALTHAGELAEALALFEALPAKVCAMRTLRLLHLNLLSGLDAEKHRAALALFRRDYPQDPSLVMQELAAALIGEAPELGLSSVAALESRVGQDAELSLLRADFQGELGRLKAQRASIRQAIALEPKNENVWWNLLNFCVEHDRHAETRKVLMLLERDFDCEWDLSDPDYEDAFKKFLASPEGAPWKEAHSPAKESDSGSEPPGEVPEGR